MTSGFGISLVRVAEELGRDQLRLPAAREGDELAAPRFTHPSGPPLANLSRLPPGVSVLLPGVRWVLVIAAASGERFTLGRPAVDGSEHLANRPERMMPSVLQECPPDYAWRSSRGNRGQGENLALECRNSSPDRSLTALVTQQVRRGVMNY